MKCFEFVDFILDYLSNGLTVETRAAFERHLSRCDSCRKYLDGYLQAMALGRKAFDADDEPVPASVPEELVAGILLARRTSKEEDDT